MDHRQLPNMMVYRCCRMIACVLVTNFFLLNVAFANLAPNYKFMHESTKAPRVSFYHYIIIGGGTAGIPLATTLSKKYSVLLLERGKSPYSDPNITRFENLGGLFTETSPDSPAQPFVADGVVSVRPRVLGGGTSVNLGFYSRGEEEFNKEARLTDQDLILDSYKWTEEKIVHEPVVGNWQSAIKAGLVEAGVKPDNGYTFDHLVGTKTGGTLFDKNGTRHPAADLLQYANPKKMTVYLHATVHKILFKSKGRSRPKAYGVVFEDSLGKKHVTYLKGRTYDEIILSAGALGSPQLLMLSGIGPKDQLDALNIPIVLEQPFVGKNMADNPLNAVFVPSPIHVEQSVVQVVGITSFGSYIEAGGGFNYLFANLSAYQGYTWEKGGFFFEKINGPLSKGELKILNVNPGDNPNVTFNYFSVPEDLEKCVKGLETVINVINSKAFSSKYKLPNMTIQDILDLNMKLPFNLLEHGNTSTSLQQQCKDTVRTIYHYHGGCNIGQVIDDDYKVLGVDSLRVVDGSTLLNSPGTNPQASLMMLGRYMGVTILSQRIAKQG